MKKLDLTLAEEFLEVMQMLVNASQGRLEIKYLKGNTDLPHAALFLEGRQLGSELEIYLIWAAEKNVRAAWKNFFSKLDLLQNIPPVYGILKRECTAREEVR